ncbi:MAG: RNase adapter RapZ [Candidatus Ventricola sp.]
MKFVIVTGLSGAGKTSVLKHLEDIGYQCMDNLPPLLLSQAITLCAKMELDCPVALGVDSRSGALFNAEAVLEAIDGGSDSHDISILFLDADTETLIDRYKETRRDHPLMRRGKTLEACIARERELLQPLRERAQYVLSTAGISVKALCAQVDDLIAHGSVGQQTLRTEIMSFGYKRGIPRESDLVFDVRFLPNPYYIKEIRAYTGLEAPVRDYVLGKEETRAFLTHLYALVDYLLPLYQREGKRRLMIAIGCTGGAHRSVAISEALCAHLRALGQTVNVSHRDIALEEGSWPFRRERSAEPGT